MIHEFDCQIYPRKLWVSIGTEELKDFDNLPEFEEADEAIVDETFNTKTNEGGIILRFKDLKTMTTPIIAHESSHVAMFIYDYIGASVDLYNQEPFAYLVEWIAKCCETVLNKEK